MRTFRYAPTKWSIIKEVIGHIADTERVIGVSLVIYRSRRDSRTLKAINDDMYVLKATFDKQSMQDLLENLIVVRQSNLAFY